MKALYAFKSRIYSQKNLINGYCTLFQTGFFPGELFCALISRMSKPFNSSRVCISIILFEASEAPADHNHNDAPIEPLLEFMRGAARISRLVVFAWRLQRLLQSPIVVSHLGHPQGEHGCDRDAEEEVALTRDLEWF